MNKFRWGFALILIAVLTFGGAALVAGQEGGATIPATVSTFEVQLRLLPDVAYPSVGQVAQGDDVTLIGRSAPDFVGNIMWVQVQSADGIVGWANTRAFEFEGDVASLDVTVPSATQGITTAANTTLRPGPTMGGFVARIGPGTLLDIVGTNAAGDWLYVETPDGAAGWIAAEALTFMSGHAPEGLFLTNASVVSESGGSVNYRVAPSLEAAQRGYGDVGDRLLVLGVSEDGEWYYVVPSETRIAVWVFGQLVNFDPGAGAMPTVDAEGNVVEAGAEEAPAPEATPEVVPAA